MDTPHPYPSQQHFLLLSDCDRNVGLIQGHAQLRHDRVHRPHVLQQCPQRRLLHAFPPFLLICKLRRPCRDSLFLLAFNVSLFMLSALSIEMRVVARRYHHGDRRLTKSYYLAEGVQLLLLHAVALVAFVLLHEHDNRHRPRAGNGKGRPRKG